MMLRHLKMIKFMYHTNISYLLKKNSEINRYIYNFFPCQVKNFNSSHRSHLKISEKKEKKVGLKSTKDSKIMLIHPDESESVVLLEEAEKLAKRRNLRLEKVETDIHAERDQYKLIDSLENIIQNEKLKTDETNSLKLKATKLFIIQSKITIHDINIKLRNINKSLEKNFKVKIMIFYSENIKVRSIVSHIILLFLNSLFTLFGVSKTNTFFYYRCSNKFYSKMTICIIYN